MNQQKPSLDENIAFHIFTVSAGMVGVCLTVIGLVQIIIHSRKDRWSGFLGQGTGIYKWEDALG